MEAFLYCDGCSFRADEDAMTNRVQKLLCSAEKAVAQIQSGQTLVVGGFVGAAHPESLTAALEQRYLQSGEPRDLTLVYAAGQGDGQNRGLNHLAHKRLLKRVIGGHWGLAPGLGRLARQGLIEAYNFPQGVVCQLLRDIAGGRPGTITQVGWGTFIDPAHQGGRLNDRTQENLVERVSLGGQNWLWYKAFPIDVGFIRASAADAWGNLLMDREAIIGEVLAIAQAVRNSGGIVIAQVGKILEEPALPQRVRVPGILVDHLVLSGEGEHDQTFGESFNKDYCEPAPRDQTATRLASLPVGPRRIIAARACDEMQPGDVVNLGIGMPEGIARIAAERGLLGDVTLTVESGPIGGMPAGGLSFGASHYPQAIIDQPAQFDFYDGGGLDFAALGAAQIDASGNVNVSKFGDRFAGVGGFVNISQCAKRLVFCGTFTSGKLDCEIAQGCLTIRREGTVRKFLREVEQCCFNAAHALKRERQILYVTERAVFEFTSDGLELKEVAPGIDLERDLLAHMEFRPVIREPKPMPPHVFAPPVNG